MQIGLLGYGRMGKMIEHLAQSYDCRITYINDPGLDIIEGRVEDADVLISFSTPKSATENIFFAIDSNKPIVVGTTGWQNNLGEIELAINKSDKGMIFGANFSVGMNAFFKMIETSTTLMNNLKQYDVSGFEAHHTGKLDSPSGTAKKLADLIIKNSETKHLPLYETCNRKIEKEELQFSSVRCGSIPGTHSITFDSPFDTIELKHTARTREGFAVGAILAAKWIRDKKGIHEFYNVFDEIMKV